LDLDPSQLAFISELFVRADFVPEQRVRCFSGLAPTYCIVGWSLSVERVEVQKSFTRVGARVSPLLREAGGGPIGVLSVYREEYRIVDGHLQFLSAEPMKLQQAIKMLASF
jgi:hypothetical protein